VEYIVYGQVDFNPEQKTENPILYDTSLYCLFNLMGMIEAPDRESASKLLKDFFPYRGLRKLTDKSKEQIEQKILELLSRYRSSGGDSMESERQKVLLRLTAAVWPRYEDLPILISSGGKTKK
jgi:hypothetical protein